MSNTCVIINFMTMIRSIQKQFSAKTFTGLIENNVYYAKRISSLTMVNFVFDIYIKLIKQDLDRLKWGLHVTYEIADIYPCIALPSMRDSFQ